METMQVRVVQSRPQAVGTLLVTLPVPVKAVEAGRCFVELPTSMVAAWFTPVD